MTARLAAGLLRAMRAILPRSLRPNCRETERWTKGAAGVKGRRYAMTVDIRAAFDKMCGYTVTLGLQSPRRGKRLPVVLSAEEVTRLLQAAPSLRDKLLLGLMYATGMRVSEVCRLKWRDLDFDRRVVNIWEGKGRTDRQVMLPVSFEPPYGNSPRRSSPAIISFPATQRPASLAAIRRTGHGAGREDRGDRQAVHVPHDAPLFRVASF